MSDVIWRALGLLSCALLMACGAVDERLTRVGSKAFTESVILGEMACGLFRARGAEVEHRAALGGTRILWRAIVRGEIDLYPDYTGTLAREILHVRDPSPSSLRSALAGHGLVMSDALGFQNTYALGMREQRASALEITKISQLAAHPELRIGFTSELLARADGWPALKATYGLGSTVVRGLDHDLAYRGLIHGDLDVTDLYSTDPEIQHHGLRVLEDDRHAFHEYSAVFVYRSAWARRAPELVAQLSRLSARLNAPLMRKLNHAVKFARRPEAEVSASFLAEQLRLDVPFGVSSRLAELLRRTREHLFLVATSLLASIGVGLPLGVLAARRRGVGHVLLALVGILQTLPSLALLVFMIPMLGIGPAPAIAALFLYSLLPIVRATSSGLTSIAPGLVESATALGLGSRVRLLEIELPLAAPAILSGIKTSAVINVGTATLGALVGAGGLGEPIFAGIRLDDYGSILTGAVPAALLALLIQGAFDLCEGWLVPEGLRDRPASARQDS